MVINRFFYNLFAIIVDKINNTTASKKNKQQKNNRNVPHVKITFVNEASKLFLITNKIPSTTKNTTATSRTPERAPCTSARLSVI